VLKKVIMILVLGFAIYWLLNAPAGAAESVRGAVNAVLDAFARILVFVQELFSS
jgi:hypothetical protein